MTSRPPDQEPKLLDQVSKVLRTKHYSIRRAKRPEHLPVILSLEEVRQIVNLLPPTYALRAKLLYGCGLRISECAKLRVHPVR